MNQFLQTPNTVSETKTGQFFASSYFASPLSDFPHAETGPTGGCPASKSQNAKRLFSFGGGTVSQKTEYFLKDSEFTNVETMVRCGVATAG
jgi:hypothetical protein